MAETRVGGEGGCERGVEFALICRGGPRVQADFDGSFVGVDAVVDLLILQTSASKGRKGDGILK